MPDTPTTTREAPPRLMAQLRRCADEKGVPRELADAAAEREGMTLKRFERMAPALALLPSLADRNGLSREARDRIARTAIDIYAQRDESGPGYTEVDLVRREGSAEAQVVQRETSMEDAAMQTVRKLVIDAAADADPMGGRAVEPALSTAVGHSWDHGAGLRARLADGLTARIDRSHEPTIGRDFARLELADTCMELARAHGERPGSRAEAIRMATGGGYHTTSDFAAITADAMSNAVGRSFEQRTPDLARASREVPRVDYHQGQSLTLSASGMPREVLEGAEIEFVTMDEQGEPLPKLRDFAAGFNLTNRAIVNDRLDLLQRASDRMVQGAIERMRAVLLEPLKANAGAGQTMADGNPLFHASRGNLAGIGSVLSETALSEARTAMRKQVGPQGELYAIEPWALVVPAELETTAQKVVAEVTPPKADDANPFAGALEIIVEPGLTDPEAWYLVADPARYDGLAHAFLDGQRAPRVESRPAWETLGLQFRLVWALDARFIGTASWFRNEGNGT